MTPSVTRRKALVSFGTICGSALLGLRAYSQAPDRGGIASNGSLTRGLLSLADYEAMAREKMSHVAWEYIESGSADEATLRWNREALQRIRVRPRVLIDVSKVDVTVSLFGQKLAHPILLAPTAAHMQVHAEGEVATVRGAGAAGAIMVASTLSNRTIEDTCAAASRPVWFQLYMRKDRGATRDSILRAEAAGCRALCVTVDLPIVYGRNRAARVDSEMPSLPLPNLGLSSASPTAIRGLRSASFNWRDLEWLRSFAKTPILLKGILNPDDAEQAVKSGVAGIIVSNHGGRGLDSVPATIDALPQVAERVTGRIPVLVDGGIRRGTDILKGLALGASAILIGRPYLHGLSVNGADGVQHVVDILQTELEAAMALTGRTTIASIDRSVIW